jgi:serine/threonine protein kinase
MENYLKIESLGRGTFGNVYLVKNLQTSKVDKFHNDLDVCSQEDEFQQK